MTNIVVLSGNSDGLKRKHTCDKCGNIFYSLVFKASKHTHETLELCLSNHHCNQCGCKSIPSCYITSDDVELTIDEILENE